MKISISISEKEMRLFKGFVSKVKNQIIDPIKGQILTLMGKNPESKEKEEPVKARIREFYENSMIVTTEKWDENGLNASIEIKSNFIERVCKLAMTLIDEAAPSIGAFSGAMMIFYSFINSASSKIKSFCDKIKEEEEKDVVYTNNIFFPNESTVVNALIRKNAFGSAENIGWVIESSKKLTFEEELRLVEKIEIAIENNDYSNLNYHFVVASFTNKEEAEKWFRDRNKISTNYNVVRHINGWTTKDWMKKEKEEENKKEKEEDKKNKEDTKEKIENLLKNLIDCFDRFKADQNEENLVALRESYDSAHEYWISMTMEEFEKMTSIKSEANSLISESKNWLGW